MQLEDPVLCVVTACSIRVFDSFVRESQFFA